IESLNKLPLHSLKFHQLQIIRGTLMAKQYDERPTDFYKFNLDGYLNIMADLVEGLNPEIVLERIAGEVNPQKSLLEGWGIRYDQVLKRFEKVLEDRDSWQGKTFIKN
ncbi:MAG TPA: hypothetical protein VJ951_03360, partial [Bacteroidales bacterium]|nr:hypothetical protein [Bacteroidales bacterium]